MRTTSRFAFAVILGVATALGAAAQDSLPVSRFLTVDGVKIGVVEQGTAGPSLVFISGLGEDHNTWRKVQPSVSSFALTLSYDRPGLGRSESTTAARGVENLSEELQKLLRASGIPRPYILVGHSLGGAIVRLFASRYPADVGGLVLVDPEDGRLLDSLRAHMDPAQWRDREAALTEAMPNMPAPVRSELSGLNASSASMSNLPATQHIPVVLLTGTKKNPSFPGNPMEQDLKLEIHRTDLARMPGASHVLVSGSRHYIQDDEPQIVIEAIKSVISSMRPPRS